MRFSTSLFLAGLAGISTAFPGMGDLMKELARRQTGGGPPVFPFIPIGDLATQGATTPVGQEVLGCLNGTTTCQNLAPKTYTPPGSLGSKKCFLDTCCVWDFVSNDLQKLFVERDGTCNDLARAAVRLGFHDAGAWSTTSEFGGADGSLILSPDEISRPENRGLQQIREVAIKLRNKYARFGVGAADLAQFMHNVAVVVCPLGPRVLTLVGRLDRSASDPPNLLPNTNSPAADLINLFSQKTINSNELTALLGAHTSAKQFFVDPSRAGQPLDTTPGIWDVKFYNETLQSTPPAGTFRLPSDQSLSQVPAVQGGFNFFANPVNGQVAWNGAYAKSYLRLSLLGVDRINKLTDCTQVLPNFQPNVPPPQPSAPVHYNHR